MFNLARQMENSSRIGQECSVVQECSFAQECSTGQEEFGVCRLLYNSARQAKHDNQKSVHFKLAIAHFNTTQILT